MSGMVEASAADDRAFLDAFERWLSGELIVCGHPITVWGSILVCTKDPDHKDPHHWEKHTHAA